MTSTAARTSSENVTSRFCSHFWIIQSQHGAKCVLTIQKLNWNQRFRDKTKLNIPSSCAHVVLTTAKQVISRHRKNENVCGMSKNEKYTCKVCKSIVFHCQIWKFVTFLLPLSSWLRKLPKIIKTANWIFFTCESQRWHALNKENKRVETELKKYSNLSRN